MKLRPADTRQDFMLHWKLRTPVARIGAPILAALTVISVILSAATAQAQSANSFGKTITVVVHTPPGGGYDAYARLLARHLGRFLAGNPPVIVANKPGAGGYLAANYAASVAPRDGT